MELNWSMLRDHQSPQELELPNNAGFLGVAFILREDASQEKVAADGEALGVRFILGKNKTPVVLVAPKKKKTQKSTPASARSTHRDTHNPSKSSSRPNPVRPSSARQRNVAPPSARLTRFTEKDTHRVRSLFCFVVERGCSC